MNLLDKHDTKLPFSEISLFESQEGTTSALYIMGGVQLTNQKMQVPAIVICVNGVIVFQDKIGNNERLDSGDFIQIEPFIEYSLKGLTDSQILLIK